MLEDFKEPAPEGAELEAFLAAPKHHLARLIRDLFSEEASATSMEVGMTPWHPLALFPSVSLFYTSNRLYPRLSVLSSPLCRSFECGESVFTEGCIRLYTVLVKRSLQ